MGIIALVTECKSDYSVLLYELKQYLNIRPKTYIKIKLTWVLLLGFWSCHSSDSSALCSSWVLTGPHSEFTTVPSTTGVEPRAAVFGLRKRLASDFGYLISLQALWGDWGLRLNSMRCTWEHPKVPTSVHLPHTRLLSKHITSKL